MKGPKTYIELLEHYCRKCRQVTNHGVIRSDEESETDLETKTTSFLFVQRIECCGCEIKSSREFSIERDDSNPDTNLEEKITNESIIPISKKWYISVNSNFNKHLPDDTLRLYKEVIDNFNAENEISCAIALRTLFEGIGIQEGVKNEIELEGIKKHSIGIIQVADRLVLKGIISKKIADIIKGLRFLGNDAAHDMIRPSQNELNLALQIAEHIFEELYVIQNMFNELQSMVEKRKMKPETRR